MHFTCVFTLLQWCVLVGLVWAKPMMFLSLHVTCSCIFHTYVFVLVLFCVFLSLSPSLFLLVSCSIAPKRKSTPSQNPLHSGASFSSPSDSTPSHVQFYDDNARKDFSENISRWGIHLERQVVLSDFFDTDLPTIIYSRGWESLCGIPVTCPSMII